MDNILERMQERAELPILILGAASIDFVGRLDADPKLGTSNPARIRTSFGGTARNVSENLARLGHPAILLSAIGNDTVGRQLLEHTGQAGVDTTHVVKNQSDPTGSYLATINPQGDLHFALDDMRALSDLSPEYLAQRAELFQQAAMLFLDANVPADTLKAAVDMAIDADIPICADPTTTSLAHKIEPFIDKLFFLTPNAAEAAYYCEMEDAISGHGKAQEAAKKLVTRGVHLAIVTLAEFGLSYATSETSGHIPAIRTQIVDPTGGGDALSAAVIFALLNGIPIDEAVRLGVSAASLTLRHPGAVFPDLSLEMLYDQLII
ncbi:MAG: carbohydrate kinase family protein [Anaerolineae bacterium]|nr:carbohydrate kinase family protein [Anaerolineae bacterium]